MVDSPGATAEFAGKGLPAAPPIDLRDTPLDPANIRFREHELTRDQVGDFVQAALTATRGNTYTDNSGTEQGSFLANTSPGFISVDTSAGSSEGHIKVSDRRADGEGAPHVSVEIEDGRLTVIGKKGEGDSIEYWFSQTEVVETTRRIREAHDKKNKEIQQEKERQARIRASAEPPAFSVLSAPTSLERVSIADEIHERFPTFTKELLRRENLHPLFPIRITDSRVIYFSDIFRSSPDSKKLAVVGFVDDGKTLTPRIYYHSRSHSNWKDLPGFRALDGASDKGGWNEEVTTLPIPLQRHLDTIFQRFGAIDTTDPDVFLTIYQAPAKPADEYATLIDTIDPEGNFGHPTQLGDYLDGTKSPAELGFADPDHGMAPNLLAPGEKWEAPTTHRGTVTRDVVPSYDGTVNYLFTSDKNGGLSLSADLVNVGVRPNGLRGAILDLGLLTTPALEHSKAARGLSGEQWARIRLGEGGYGDITRFFQDKIPLFQRYKELRLGK